MSPPGSEGTEQRPNRWGHPEELTVFLDSELRITIEAFLARYRHERGGVLLGEHRDGRTLVTAAIFPNQQVSSEVACAFDISVIDVVHAALEPFGESRERPWSIVGWIHSHPRMGVFLSEQDWRTLKSWTDLDRDAVAMVVDPHSKTSRVGAWGQGGHRLGVGFTPGAARSLDLTEGALLANELRANRHEHPAMFWGVVCSNGVVDVRPASGDMDGGFV